MAFFFGKNSIWSKISTTSGRGCLSTSHTDIKEDRQTNIATLWLYRPRKWFSENCVACWEKKTSAGLKFFVSQLIKLERWRLTREIWCTSEIQRSQMLCNAIFMKKLKVFNLVLGNFLLGEIANILGFMLCIIWTNATTKIREKKKKTIKVKCPFFVYRQKKKKG